VLNSVFNPLAQLWRHADSVRPSLTTKLDFPPNQNRFGSRTASNYGPAPQVKARNSVESAAAD